MELSVTRQCSALITMYNLGNQGTNSLYFIQHSLNNCQCLLGLHSADSYNSELSQKRAKAVARELICNRVRAERITVQGRGEEPLSTEQAA